MWILCGYGRIAVKSPNNGQRGFPMIVIGDWIRLQKEAARPGASLCCNSDATLL